MFTHGHGVRTDYSAALLWFQRAVATEDASILDKAAAAAADLERSIRRAEEWREDMLAQFDAEDERFNPDGAHARKQQSVELPAELLDGLQAGDILTLNRNSPRHAEADELGPG